MNNEDYIKALPNAERRFYNAKAEARAAAGESREIYGLAAVTNVRTNIGWFTEEIMPGAFDGADLADVRCLGNHEANIILGRTTNGSLRLEIDQNGQLRYVCDVIDTTEGTDWLKKVRSGLIDQSSFAFTVPEGGDQWTEESGQLPHRKIYKIDRVYDVSPVTYAAYGPATQVSARALQYVQQSRPQSKHLQAYYEVLYNSLNK